MFLKILFSVFCSFLIFSSTQAAVIKITNVSVSQGSTGEIIDVTFDKAFSAKSMKPTYERNFIQVALKGTGIDSARIVPAIGGTTATQKFQKVFAYPYTQDTTRLRIIFDGEKAPQGKLSFWNSNAKTVRFMIKGEGAKVVPSTAQAAVAEKHTPEKNASASEDEKQALKEVVENTKEIDIHNPESVKGAIHAINKASGVKKNNDTKEGVKNFAQDEENTPIATTTSGEDAEEKKVGTQSNPSKYFFRMAASLIVLLGIFVGIVFLVKRYAGNLKKLPFGKKERIIQVIATHYLGNKKSISLVKVAGECMVVGVGNEGISLISKLGPEVDVDKYLEDRFWGGTFEKHLKSYEKSDEKKTEAKTETSAEKKMEKKSEPFSNFLFSSNAGKKAANYDGVRDLNPSADSNLHLAADDVTDKVEISSFRNNIKEKLSKLKPLS